MISKPGDMRRVAARERRDGDPGWGTVDAFAPLIARACHRTAGLESVRVTRQSPGKLRFPPPSRIGDDAVVSAEQLPHRSAPALLCFDGSEGAAAAIHTAGPLLGPRPAVVLSVWEPLRVWEPWDPVTFVSGPLERLIATRSELDEIVADLAREKAEQGVALARAAGFDAQARVAGGRVWEKICEVAEELDVAVIVVGSRGLGRAGSAVLGSVSTAVIAHARRAVLVGPAHPRSQPGRGDA